MYRFYYSYKEEVYGVLEHHRTKSLLDVELIRTQEKEQVDSDWLLKQIQDGEADIAKNKERLDIYKQEFLSDYLPTSS